MTTGENERCNQHGRPNPAREILSARRSRSSDRRTRRVRQPPALSREHRQSNPADVYFGRSRTSCWKEKGSNARRSKTVGCFTTNKPRKITMMRQLSPASGRLLSQNLSTTAVTRFSKRSSAGTARKKLSPKFVCHDSLPAFRGRGKVLSLIQAQNGAFVAWR